ncbi:hypothetical protein [Nocardioides bigeumensis]|uniref:VanZ-like domain-containing protein n=1 Tax=Nocardioides bigeumensis TaxID=433657 RepID=A0ABN2XZ31_9ACTN
MVDKGTGEARGRGVPAWVPAGIYALTMAQLAVATFVPGIDRFADKAFGARLVGYALLMALVPAIWFLVERRRRTGKRPPHGAFALVLAPFLVDVTGNSLDLYDSLVWWDDLNHFANWALLCGGLGAILLRSVRPHWVLVLAVTGFGAVLAIGWELGEWWTFIRHGTELDTAYEDTLGDLTLGTLGSLVAGLALWRWVLSRP